MTLLDVTSPNGLKASSRRLSVVAHARPPTKHLCSSPIFLNTKNRQYFDSKVYELQNKTFEATNITIRKEATSCSAAGWENSPENLFFACIRQRLQRATKLTKT
jgi:hypothetical protein